MLEPKDGFIKIKMRSIKMWYKERLTNYWKHDGKRYVGRNLRKIRKGRP